MYQVKVQVTCIKAISRVSRVLSMYHAYRIIAGGDGLGEGSLLGGLPIGLLATAAFFARHRLLLPPSSPR